MCQIRIMELPEEVFLAFAAAEIAMRRQFLLRGYELGRGGGRLDPEDAVALLDEHFAVVMADVHESIREERDDLDRAKQVMHKVLDSFIQVQRPEMEAVAEQLKQKMAVEIEQMREVKADLARAREVARQATETLERVEQVLPRWRTLRVDELLRRTVGRPPIFPVRAPDGQTGVGYPWREVWSPWRWLRGRRGAARDVLKIHWQDQTSSVLRGEALVEFMPTMLFSDHTRAESPAGG